jgi:hypothetical protein
MLEILGDIDIYMFDSKHEPPNYSLMNFTN